MTDTTKNTGRDIAKAIVSHFYLHDDEETYSASIRNLWKNNASDEDINLVHELLKATIDECSDDQFMTWTCFLAGLCCKEDVSVKTWGDDVHHVIAALKAVVTIVTDSIQAMKALVQIHRGNISVLQEDEGVDGLGTAIFQQCVASRNYQFLKWIFQQTSSVPWDSSRVVQLVCDYAGQDRIAALLGIMAFAAHHDEDDEVDDDTGELDAFLDPEVGLAALQQSPIRAVTSGDVSRILSRYRISSGKRALIGKPLDPTSFKQYTGFLSRLSSEIFPHKPEEVLLWLTQHNENARTLQTRVSQVCKFMESMRRQEGDSVDIEREKSKDRHELFGGEEAFSIAYEIYRQDCLAKTEQQKRDAATATGQLSTRDEALWEHETTLRRAYEARVKVADKLKQQCRKNIQLQQVTRENISALQEQAILEIYMEHPPLRSLEFQLMQYDPPSIDDDTNYVEGNHMIINRDKTSFQYGTYRMPMTALLQNTVELLINCRKARGFTSGRLFQRHDEAPYTRSGFTEATYQAFAKLIGKKLGCRMLRKIVQTGKTARGELQWPSQRRAFHQASRHSAAVAEAHYVIESAQDLSPVVNVPEPVADDAVSTTSERSEYKKRQRTAWGKDVESWFSEHCGDRTYLVGDGHRDWSLMANHMNTACGSRMEGVQLKNRYCNLEKKRKKLSQQAAAVTEEI